jgi:dihydroorotate dehydrogenase|tara:strand:- start:39 stop:332 length:294 start_codon:yes stop_codon:yes gene_type:complete
MPRYKNINGVEIQLTAEEEAQRDLEEQTFNNGALDRALKEFRNKRNNLLAETDWMANSDVTMSDEWKTYRTQLRDLPSGLDTVEKVNAKEFPTKPSE